MHRLLTWTLMSCTLALPSVALAQVSLDASASVSTETGVEADANAAAEGDASAKAWIDRYPPRANTFELGGFLGLYIPSADHELFNKDLGFASDVHEEIGTAFDIGLRAGYYPLEFLGLELEGARMWAMTDPDENGVRLWAIRGHVLGQLPGRSIAPFALIGVGALGVESETYAVGDDDDPALHLGVGAKAFLSRNVVARLDIRPVFARGLGKDDGSTSWEFLLGVSAVLGGKEEAPPPPPDSDGDGFLDAQDACPTEPGVAPDGCPVRDADGDGIADPQDACPNEAGPANEDPAKNGCPPPPDRDGDGVPDETDKCPDIAAQTADGCPGDSDGDGIRDDQDKCPAEPETANGFEDTDGCPDEVPEEVKKFTGAIKGIYFAINKATIKKRSHKVLDQAVKVLTDYPDLKIEISGHTDSTGKEERNRELSGERADSVKAYLIEQGIAADRIQTRGAGPDEPVADNKTKAGRAQNRRIEFKLIQ